MARGIYGKAYQRIHFTAERRKLASDKFWELEKRINKDKRGPGVIIQYRKTDVMMILLKLINDSVITFDDLDGFSDNVKGSLKFIAGADQA